MNKLSKLTLLLAGFGILFVHSTMAGPFERFRERLAEFKRQRNPASPASPASPTSPTSPTFNSANLGDTIWRGIMTVNASEIAHFKDNQKQQYSVTNPSISVIVEIWFPSSTTWFCVLDLTGARGSNDDADGIYDPKKRKWEPMMGTAPSGLVGDGLPLDGYVGSGSLDPSTKKIQGGRDNDPSDPNNSQDCMVLIGGSYTFGGTISKPTLIISGASTYLPSKKEGVRILSAVTSSGTFDLTTRKVSQDKNEVGGFTDLP